MAARTATLLRALRVEATVLMSLAIGQAGLAAGFLGGQESLEAVHGINAIVVSVVTLALLVTAIAYQRAGGPRWTILATGILLAVEVLQITLARFEAKGPHIFLGVLFVTMATLLTSYLFRPGFVPTTR